MHSAWIHYKSIDDRFPFLRNGGFRYAGITVPILPDSRFLGVGSFKQFKNLAAKTTGEPWQRVNAAFGYALYDNEDSVEDVFRKADHIMYEHKKEMKQNNIKRRDIKHEP